MRLAPGGVSGLTNVEAVIASQSRGCALRANGALLCWGENGDGQLGDGTTTDRLTPVAVSELSSAIAASVAPFFSCAVLADGSVRCWGQGAFGALGDGTNTDHLAPGPAVSGLSSAVAIAAGTVWACALRADGTVRCWGANGHGELGDGTTTFQPTPVAVSGLSNAVAITAGAGHTCALRADGTVGCWGLNNEGQLGDGTTANRLTRSP
jgi:alpha-tubulin suppressor-like RCC1 family protein